GYFLQRRAAIKDAPLHRRRSAPGGNGAAAVSNATYRQLASGFPDRGLHPYYIQDTAEPANSALHSHHGEEFIYVLDGQLELVTYAGDRESTELLRAGDSVFLESSVPHLVRGHSRNPYASKSAELIDVFWTPLGIDYLFEA